MKKTKLNEQKKVIRKNAANKFGRALKALDILGDQTAVHRRKFEYVLEQIRKFQAWYSSLDPEVIVVNPETKYMKVIMNNMQELKQILSQYILQTWTVPTLQNHPNHVYEQLQEVLSSFHSVFSSMNPSLAGYFDPESEDFKQYHIYDLRAIAASFAAYLQRDQEDLELMNQITARLSEITAELAEHDKSNITASREFSPIPINYQQWRVNISDFEIEEEIGHGLSSQVFKGIYKKTGEKVALKRFKDMKLNGTRLQFFQREVAVLAVLSKYAHPCLIKFIGATDTPPFTIITEYMTKGSLYTDIRKNHQMNPTQLTIAAYDIARGMQYLHSCQLVHRDLKSLNVLLDDDYHIRICDFGFTRSVGGDDTFKAQNMGTPQWMAPELLESTRHYTSKIDVYSYAIVLTEILTGSYPYPEYEGDTKALKKKIIEDDIRPVLPPTCTPMMRDLITQSWDKNPDVRPTFDEIVKRFEKLEIYFQGCDMDALKEYIKKSKTSQERIMHRWGTNLENLRDKKITCKTFLSKLYNEKIPPSLIDKAWDIFIEYIKQNMELDYKQTHEKEGNSSNNANENNEEIASKDIKQEIVQTTTEHLTETIDSISIGKLMTFFVNTSKMKEAIEILRKLPNNSLNDDIINKFLSIIPTGSNEIDSNIIITACKNNLAPLAAVYAQYDKDLTLALEVCLHKPIDKNIQAAIIDKCAESLIRCSEMGKIASMKVLIALNAHHLIPESFLDIFLRADDKPELQNLAFLAAMQSPTFPTIDICMKMLHNENAKLVCLSACEKENFARYILPNVFSCDDKIWIVNVFGVASQFKSLSDLIRQQAKKLDVDSTMTEDSKQLLSMVLTMK